MIKTIVGKDGENMNTFMMLLFVISMLGGIVFFLLFVLSIFVKKFKVRKRKYGISLIITCVLFLVSAFGYNATLSDEQKAEIEQQRIEREKEKAEKDNKKKEEQKKAEQEKAEQELEKNLAKEKEVEKKAEKEAAEKETKKKTEEKTEKAKGEVKQKSEKEITKKAENTTKAESKKEPVKYQYDVLQNLFMSITDKTTVSDIDTYIANNSLAVTSQEYNKSGGGKELTYKIAYTEGVAAQKYADSGDHIEISFDKDKSNQIMTAQYVMEEKPDYTALFYNYGTWYDFREDAPSKYTGYYIVDTFGKNKGIVIQYKNGNKTDTNYFECKSAEKTVQKVIDKKD